MKKSLAIFLAVLLFVGINPQPYEAYRKNCRGQKERDARRKAQPYKDGGYCCNDSSANNQSY